jgi:acyl carrier protein
MESYEELVEKLKGQIIEALKLEDISPEDIDADEPLFVEGLGLDSIDALELIVILDKHYGIKIKTADDGKTVLQSVSSIAKYIQENKK